MALKTVSFIRQGYHRFVETQQVRMSSSFDGLPLLALLGLICGLISGGIIDLFRLFIEGSASLYMPGGNLERFEDLSVSTRFWLCAGGGLLVGLLMQMLKPRARIVGVVHVIERLEYHQGHLPLRNAIVQFVAGSISLLSGHSVGREGPSVHLGATAGSLLGRKLKVPNNSVRILVGCGVAAAISAAFNTPLAGVIFAMEVVIMEYTVIGFTPVIIAAVSATTLTRAIFGDASAFSVQSFELNILQELPVIILLGALVGCVSAAFIQSTLLLNSLVARQQVWLRIFLAGIITGLIAMLIPQIMGIGYDTINHVLLAQIGLAGVLILTLAKVMATSVAMGMGIPAGLIGPTLFMGATAGSAIGIATEMLFPGTANVGLYALLGMAAMMAATLQAPLAALIYLLELSANQEVILPGMAAVITASLVTQVVFKKSSIYRELLLARGLDYRNTPMSKTLRRIGVASIMERNIPQHTRYASLEQAKSLLFTEPRWILLLDPDKPSTNYLLPGTDLARHLQELTEAASQSESASAQDSNHELDLMNIPALHEDTAPIPIVATLQEAQEMMEKRDCEVLYITGAHGATKNRVYGVITREHIDRAYYSQQ